MEDENLAFNDYEYDEEMDNELHHKRHLTSAQPLETENTTRYIDTTDKEKEYVWVKEIGQGTFGVVYQAYHTQNKQTFAIKKVYQDPKCINREFSIVKELYHPNVIKIHDSFFTENEHNPQGVNLNIVMDFIPTTLNKMLRYYHKMGKQFPPMLAKLLIYQMLRSLAYIRGLRILHRDIKPPNILIDMNDYRLVLCDFGCAKKYNQNEESISYICSRFYRSPELILGSKNYGCEVDIWSAGCVIAEMFLGDPLFCGNNNKELFLRIVSILGPPTEEDLQAMEYMHHINMPKFTPIGLKKKLGGCVEPLALDLLSKMLSYNPQTRITPFQALTHPYFDELRSQKILINNREIVELFDFTEEEIGEDSKFLTKLVPEWHTTTTNK